jgi:signal peptidase I
MSSQVLSVKIAHPSAAIAALMSAFAPCVGHLYVGRPGRGVAIFIAVLVIQAIIIVAAFMMPASFGAIAAFAVGALTATLGSYLFIIVDAVRLARHREKIHVRHHWYTYVAAVAGVYLCIEIVLAVASGTNALRPWRTFNVASTSMDPTLRVGEYFLADTMYYAVNTPSRGDVVVYRLPNDPATIYIKRIVALARDRVSFRDGHVFINGAPVLEPYAKTGNPRAAVNAMADFVVPAGHVFVAGDNRENSVDSRAMAMHGPVPNGNLIGRATDIMITSVPDRAGRWIGSPR